MTEHAKFLEINGVGKSYKLGSTKVEVLKSVDLHVGRGEWVALLGASGSGKSTLLDIAGTLSKPDSGSVVLDGSDYMKMKSSQLVSFRCSKIGFIFQAYHMLPELTILENAAIPAMLLGKGRRESFDKAAKLLADVGLAHRVGHRPSELSGGEQQRAAIARSLINSPELLLADEPTGNLDSNTGSGILDIIKGLRSSANLTILMVTHDRKVAALADRIVELKDGQILSDSAAHPQHHPS